MTSFFLFVEVIAAIAVWMYLHGQIRKLRDDLGNLAVKSERQLLHAEARITRLERQRAASLVEPRPCPVPVPESTHAKALEAVPAAHEAAQFPAEPPAFAATTAAQTAFEVKPQPADEAQVFREDSPEQAHRAYEPAPESGPQPGQEKGHVRILSLEGRLGANWLNKLGIAILVIGLAFFLAFRLPTMGPGGKVFTGFAISLALLAGGIWLERKPAYRIFARAGIGGGCALLFFTTFAMHHVAAARILPSLLADLILMLLVAAGMVLHSLRYRSQTITGLTFLLGFVTVATSHLESASGTVVFSLTASAVLALGLVTVTLRRHWVWLELAGLVGVVANHFLWLSNEMPPRGGSFPLFWPSTALILFPWVIFRTAYLLRVPVTVDEDRIASLSAIVTSAGVLGLLKFQASPPEWGFLDAADPQHLRASNRHLYETKAPLRVHRPDNDRHDPAGSRRASQIPWSQLDDFVAGRGAGRGYLRPASWRTHLPPIGPGDRLCCGPGARAARGAAPCHLPFRKSGPSGHPPLTAALFLAAALFWVHGEVYPRRWTQIVADNREAVALRITSWLGELPGTVAIALLFAATRRRTVLEGSPILRMSTWGGALLPKSSVGQSNGFSLFLSLS